MMLRLENGYRTTISFLFRCCPFIFYSQKKEIEQPAIPSILPTNIHESFRIVSRNFVWSQSTFMLPFQFTVKTERAGSSLNFIFLEADIKLLTRDWRTAKIYFYVHRLMCEE